MFLDGNALRYTACTRLAESGLEPKVLQYIMGHANVSVTLDVYTHLDFIQIQEKMEAVQENQIVSPCTIGYNNSNLMMRWQKKRQSRKR